MELTKSDIEAIAQDRYRTLIKKPLLFNFCLLLLLIPAAFIPSPWGGVIMIIIFTPTCYLFFKLMSKGDRFVKDFVKRWESGEITFNKGGE